MEHQNSASFGRRRLAEEPQKPLRDRVELKTSTPLLWPIFDISDLFRHVGLRVSISLEYLESMFVVIIKYIHMRPDVEAENRRVPDSFAQLGPVFNDCKFLRVVKKAIDVVNYRNIQIKEESSSTKVT